MDLTNMPGEQAVSRKDEDSFIQGVKDCVPTLLGYISIGIAAGVVQKTAGLSLAEITLMCLILYAGSAQFIAVGMMASGGSAAAIMITTLFVNLRYLLLSASLSPYFRHLKPLQGLWAGALLSDETFGVAVNKAAEKNRIEFQWMNGLNLTAYFTWWLANLAGALLGQWITNPERFGLDYALTGMFIGLLVLTLMSRRTWKPDLTAAAAAIVCVVGASFIFSGSLGIIAATIAASTIGMVIEKWK